ncbi:MAG: 3-oxo-5-alpha-steroid 4-dehydrogenase, partial [Candidatus Heimdallarchaeaceae archaeon]
TFYSADWFYGYRFILGMVLFFGGMLINRHSDFLLRNLRAPGETDYKIPYGGFFNLVSAPNYLGEIIQWFGWALATWSLAGLVFAVWTTANLLPRAIASHRWYKQRFSNYPSTRKAIIPFLL